MHTKDLSFTNREGQKIYARSYGKDGKASVLVLHGLAEHFHCYDPAIDSFLTRGFDVYGIDHRGHGRSEGDRSLILDFKLVVDDLKEFIAKYDLANDSKPRFIFAHSMGGLLALNYLLDAQFNYRAVALSGALMMPGNSIPKFLVVASKPLVKMFPLGRWVKLDPKFITKKQESRDRRAKDEFVFQGAAPNISGLKLLEAMEAMKMRLPEIQIPTLIMHGTEDKVVNPKSAQIIYEGISSEKKLLELQEGLYHEIIHEESGQAIIRRIGDYFEQQL